MDLLMIGADVDWPDSEAGTQARERLADDAALGNLAGLAEWIAGVRPPGAQFDDVRVVVIGAEADPLLVETAGHLGAQIRTVPAQGGAEDGRVLADELVDSGAQLIVVAVPGVRADAAVAASVLTNTEPVKVLARGAAATDPEAWMDLAVEVRDARLRCMPHRDSADQLLGELDSPRMAIAAGLMLQSAVRRTPVLIDGPVASAAALVAYEAQPRAVRWWAACDLGTDPLQDLALTRLGQRAVLGLGSGLGDGLVGTLAIPVVRAALRLGCPDTEPDAS